jgi:hypothetical protein
MSYSVRDGDGNTLLREGTLVEARDVVRDRINNRVDMSALKPVVVEDEDGGIISEDYILNFEDIDLRIYIAIIQHNPDA